MGCGAGKPAGVGVPASAPEKLGDHEAAAKAEQIEKTEEEQKRDQQEAKQPPAKTVGEPAKATRLSELLAEANLSSYADAIIEQGYDSIELLGAMTDDELNELVGVIGMGVGHRKKLKGLVQERRARSAAEAVDVPGEKQPAAAPAAGAAAAAAAAAAADVVRQADDGNEAAQRVGAPADALSEKSGDDAAERNVQRAGEVLESVSSGLKLASVVLTVGKHIPMLGGVCEAAKEVLEKVQEYSEKLSDVQAAGQRTLDVLEYLDMMQKNVKEIAPEHMGKVEVPHRPLPTARKPPEPT